jgi:hypothetical protein
VRFAPLALAVVALAATAPAASADDVWLWACHGPNGESLSAPTGTRATRAGGASSGCAEPGGALLAPAGGVWSFSLPSGAALQQVRIARSVDVGSGGTYRLRADTTLETTATGAEQTYDASGSQVTFDVTCPVACSGATVSAIGFRVSDTDAPGGSVGGVRSPAADTLALEVIARDVGVGLRNAAAYVDNQLVAEGHFGDPGCQDLSPSSPGVDLPFGLIGQNDQGFPPQPVGCLTRGTTSLTVNTRAFGDGMHRLVVAVADLAGNVSVLSDQQVEFDNPDVVPPSPTNTTTNPPTRGDGSDLGGAQATSCVAPKLKVVLADKPVRREKGVPVLLANGRYKFTGKLTCRVGSKRRAAPKRAILDVFGRHASRLSEDYGTTTAPKGLVSVILTFTESRTLIFRFTSAEGRRVQVEIPLLVAKARTFRPKVSIHGVWLRFETPSDRVRFSSLEVHNVPKGATVTLTCSGEGCASSRRTFRPKRKRKTISLLGPLESASLRPGTSVDVTVIKPGFHGVGKLYCVRAGQRVQTKPYRVGNRPSCG